ncbi:MAG: hypothetical protein HC808_19735 [Candidatus Competibacteraceae bacterium]|nr:hypothetical protein [Candidatus Competibacteraceae bacterium]
MTAFFGNKILFVILYLFLILPTYALPLFGSNSAAVSGLGVAAGIGVNPTFWWHLGALLGLVFITGCRGAQAGKLWFIIFPILAGAFDLLPGLSVIPFVPTVMHLLAIILGVASTDMSEETGFSNA